MNTLESFAPRRGLSIPAMTALDPDGRPIDEDQRRLVRFLIQSGRGADVIFAMGTNGEWNRLETADRHRVIRVTVEEVLARGSVLERAGHRPVEVWVGITARTAAETLETLELALDVGAHGAVIAPLAIVDVSDPVRFLARDVSDLLDVRDRRIPIYLYDNRDIAAGPVPYLRTHWVKALSRLDFVRGIKVSAPPRKLGHYTKAARQFRDLGEFGIYVGNALYTLDMMRPRRGWWGALVEHWNRFLLHDMLPAGVVSGPANVLPREWQRAWRVATAGDEERMEQMRRIFLRFRELYVFPEGNRGLAAQKRALARLGVISSDAIAKGTKALTAEQQQRFDEGFAALREEIAKTLPVHWISDPGEAGGR